MKRTANLLLVCTVAIPTATLAQGRGSADDQLACTPDVYRLCAANIPDEDAITSCLKQHKAQLSAGCNAVFSRPEQPRAKTDDDDD